MFKEWASKNCCILSSGPRNIYAVSWVGNKKISRKNCAPLCWHRATLCTIDLCCTSLTCVVRHGALIVTPLKQEVWPFYLPSKLIEKSRHLDGGVQPHAPLSWTIENQSSQSPKGDKRPYSLYSTVDGSRQGFFWFVGKEKKKLNCNFFSCRTSFQHIRGLINRRI